MSYAKIIAQQNNCVTTKSHGFSKIIADKYPYADIYSIRTNKICSKNNAVNPDVPGTIKICMDANNPTIICMLAQYLPGKPNVFGKYYDYKYPDNYHDREKYFQLCLDNILSQNITEVAMPYGIGCGLAGGNMQTYMKMMADTPLEITLYKL